MSKGGQRFSISADWVRRAGEAIGGRNGVLLKDVLSRAEAGEAVEILSDDERSIGYLVGSLAARVSEATREYISLHPLPPNHRSVAPAVAAERNGAERELCVQTAVRVAITGSLVAFQRAQGKVVQHVASSPTTAQLQHKLPASDGDAGPSPSSSSSAAAALHRSCQDTLLKGLLFAFEAFVQMHAEDRSHYPARAANTATRTVGTIGWDTLVLLHFVHHIPQIAREASGAVIDEATGELVRSWRRLLVALQTVDADQVAASSRRRGALALVNGLLIILFQRYNTHQCSVFLSAVDHAESVAQRLADPGKSILQPSQHMISEVVTYNYYKGRMRLYERRFADAHAALLEAYRLLPPSGSGTAPQHTNKQRVRFFLMVAGLLSGRRTPPQILDADPLLAEMFSPLVAGVEKGDPRAFSDALEVHGATWRRRGVYLLLQHQARLLCYMMLLVRVHAAIGALPGKDNSRITIANLIAAYSCCTGGEEGEEREERDGSSELNQRRRTKKRPRQQQKPAVAAVGQAQDAAHAAMDDDRMSLWVTQLIACGYVRGYLSHEHKTIVLSKKEPFPLLQQAAA